MSKGAPQPSPPAAPHVAANAEGASLRTTLYNGRTASHQLHVLIVGCGMGGLSAAHCLGKAGHKVTLFESAAAIGEVGAGIHLAPNASRLLLRWGAGPALRAVGVRAEAAVLRRYDTGGRVGYTRLADAVEGRHGAPYYHVHRADLHKILFDLAAPFVTVRLSATVVDVDPGAPPAVTLASGEVVRGDLVVGADGIRSVTQRVVLGYSPPVEMSGDAACRIVIPSCKLLEDPELSGLVDVPEMTGWMGPGRHVTGYNIRAKKEYFFALFHRDDDAIGAPWKAEGDLDKMRGEFADYEPRIRKLLSLAQSAMRFRLVDRKPLKTWIHPCSRVVLLGDACHPMLVSAPYRQQGAAMSIEDAAVLGNLLSRLAHADELPALLQAYEDLRLPRTADAQAQSRVNQHVFHLPDGPEQEQRDAEMRAAACRELELERVRNGNGNGNGSLTNGTGNAPGDVALEESQNVNQRADEEKMKMKSWIPFGYDADEAAETWWREVGERKLGPAGGHPGASSGRAGRGVGPAIHSRL